MYRRQQAHTGQALSAVLITAEEKICIVASYPLPSLLQPRRATPTPTRPPPPAITAHSHRSISLDYLTRADGRYTHRSGPPCFIPFISFPLQLTACLFSHPGEARGAKGTGRRPVWCDMLNYPSRLTRGLLSVVVVPGFCRCKA